MPRARSRSASMEGIGTPTLHTRVERWECDYNDHWNTRFYGRAFQSASQVFAAQSGADARNAVPPTVRHIRFHRELRVAANVEVRSARLCNADKLENAIVHILSGDGGLAATALDIPGLPSSQPPIDAADVPLALPRGLANESPGRSVDAGTADLASIELGPVHPQHCDGEGKLLFEELIRCGSVASGNQLRRAGLTPEFVARRRINRMAVELRATRHSDVGPGTLLRGLSGVAATSAKKFSTMHYIETAGGDAVATLEFCLVTVNIDSRRAVAVPDELRDGLQDSAGA